MKDEMCESCGSNIGPPPKGGYIPDKPHLCSIRTATEWRQEIPLHLRRQPLYPVKCKLTLESKEEYDAYEAWLVKHHDADAIIVDKRTGLVIQALYDCPVSMDLSERKVDFFTNVARLQNNSDDDLHR